MKDYSTKESLETPYIKAGQVWDTRMGTLTKQVSAWRLTAFGLLIGNIALIAALMILPSRTQLVPYVLEVDSLGQTKQIGMAHKANFTPNETHIIHSVQNFIYNARSLSSDTSIVKENWLKAHNILGGAGKRRFEQYLEENQLHRKIGRQSKFVSMDD